MSDPTNQNTVNSVATNLLEIAALHASRLTALLSGYPTGTANDSPTQSTPYVIQRPWVEPPEEYTPYDEASKATLTGVVPEGPLVIVQFTVPAGNDGVINRLSWNAVFGGFVQGSGDLVVQLLRNNAAIRNFDHMIVEKGSIGFASEISPVRVWSGQVIQLVVNHVNNGLLAGDIVGRLQGYFYPSKS